MSKTQIHFKSQAECDAYFSDYLPDYPSKYLIIIDSVDADSSGETKLSNVLITSTNNYNQPGSTAAVTMGTSAVETAQEKTSDNDEALTLSEYTLHGEDDDSDDDDDDSNPEDYLEIPMSIKVLKDGTNFYMNILGAEVGEEYEYTIRYSINGGNTISKTSYRESLAQDKHILESNLMSGDVITLTYISRPGKIGTPYKRGSIYLDKEHDVYGNAALTSIGNSNSKFSDLFECDTYLINAKNLTLPQTVQEYECSAMFMDCDNLITGPVLPATTLKKACYEQMFQGCDLIKSLTCLAENVSINGTIYSLTDKAYSATPSWWRDASNVGTFTKKANVEWSSWDVYWAGIPAGWTVIEI